MFHKGKSGNPAGRPRKGDSLAEAIRARFDSAKRAKAILALAKKAMDGDIGAFEVLAKRGWPDEAKGELFLNMSENAVLPVRVIHEYQSASS